MNSHTVACGGVFGIAAAGVLIFAPVVGANGDPVGPVNAIDAVGDEHPISANSITPATAVTLRFKRMAGAGRRISTVHSQRISSTYSLKT